MYALIKIVNGPEYLNLFDYQLLEVLEFIYKLFIEAYSGRTRQAPREKRHFTRKLSDKFK